MPDDDLAVQQCVDTVRARLVRRFDTLDEAVVTAIVRGCAHELRGARIRQFVPVFVERRSAERLAAMATASVGDPVDGVTNESAA